MVDVPDDFAGYAYCSIECMLYHKAILKEEAEKEQKS